MSRIIAVISIATAGILIAIGLITLYDENLKIGRMWETPAIRPYEQPLPVMASGIMPFTGGEALFRKTDAAAIQTPFNLSTPAVIEAGQLSYQRYCIHCHGKYHDGNGAVGQSFAPLPGDLRSPRVQEMPNGVVFHEISYGIPNGRQPALATTVSIDERWQAIAYIKSLGIR